MEAADPIQSETKVPIYDDISINFIEELIVNKEYKIKFGINENRKELIIIKVIPENYKEIFYYLKVCTINELQNISSIFAIYKNTKDIISFLKDRQFKIEEKNDLLIIIFNAYMPDGKGKLVELVLKKVRENENTIIKYFLEKNKDYENNIRNIKEKIKEEILDLKKTNENQISNIDKNKENILNCHKEISKLKAEKNFLEMLYFIFFIILSIILYRLYNQNSNEKENNINYENCNKKFNFEDAIIKINKEISKEKDNINDITKKIKYLEKDIKDQKLNLEDINNNLSLLKDKGIKCTCSQTEENNFDSKLFSSINSIDFILNYIIKNDKSVNFTEIKLLYRGSRDGDGTKTCHKLCDDKKNVLIFMQSDKGYIFGGYSKIGFKTTKKIEYIIDNNSFLFSVDLKKIYPVINGKTSLEYDNDIYGLCFYGLYFKDKFMNIKSNYIGDFLQLKFKGLNEEYEIKGGEKYFKIKELEVFQLL